MNPTPITPQLALATRLADTLHRRARPTPSQLTDARRRKARPEINQESRADRQTKHTPLPRPHRDINCDLSNSRRWIWAERRDYFAPASRFLVGSYSYQFLDDARRHPSSGANHQILTRTRSDEAARQRSSRSFVGPPISAVNAEPTASLRRCKLRLTLNHVVERLVYIGGWR
jgi:hypothetical protein